LFFGETKYFDTLDEAKDYAIKNYALYSRGGKVAHATFSDKVKAISKKLAGKKVPPKYKKDYGKKFDKEESVIAARRIAGAMKKKSEGKNKIIKKKIKYDTDVDNVIDIVNNIDVPD